MTPALARAASAAAPLALGALALAGWEALVRWQEIPHYILPAPSLIAAALVADRAILFPALLVTLEITAMALVAAAVGGLALAVLFAQ